MLAVLSVSGLHSHSSAKEDDPAIGCSETSASCFLLFLVARFLGDSPGVKGVEGVPETLSGFRRAGVAAVADTVSRGTGIAVVDAEKLRYAKKLASVYETWSERRVGASSIERLTVSIAREVHRDAAASRFVKGYNTTN